MKKEEAYEFELPNELEELDAPDNKPENTHTEPEIEAEDFDTIYSDNGVEDLLTNDEVDSFEAGFMHGYLEEAEEGA
ncbi:MAG TPA: hypothetical protein VJG90_04205 [Candidatus Nanoarchaeia archaeon]|nr:hypothetical protein [Candidatus Nanoarchaeia archaeon]